MIRRDGPRPKTKTQDQKASLTEDWLVDSSVDVVEDAAALGLMGLMGLVSWVWSHGAAAGQQQKQPASTSQQGPGNPRPPKHADWPRHGPLTRAKTASGARCSTLPLSIPSRLTQASCTRTTH